MSALSRLMNKLSKAMAKRESAFNRINRESREAAARQKKFPGQRRAVKQRRAGKKLGRGR